MEDFGSWLSARGRGRSADAYARATRRLVEDRDGYAGRLVDGDLSPNYRRFLAAAGRAYAKYAGDDELAELLGDLRLPPAMPVGVREPLPRDAWIRIREEIDRGPARAPLRLACALVAARGIRCGDVLRLREGELKAAQDTGILVFEAKGGRRLRFSAVAFRKYLPELLSLRWTPKARLCDLVCPGSRDPEASAGRAARREFDRAARALGMSKKDVYAHRFRHTYAQALLEMFRDDAEGVFRVRDAMGWARLETAAAYLRRDRLSEIEAVESELARNMQQTEREEGAPRSE